MIPHPDSSLNSALQLKRNFHTAITPPAHSPDLNLWPALELTFRQLERERLALWAGRQLMK